MLHAPESLGLRVSILINQARYDFVTDHRLLHTKRSFCIIRIQKSSIKSIYSSHIEVYESICITEQDIRKHLACELPASLSCRRQQRKHNGKGVKLYKREIWIANWLRSFECLHICILIYLCMFFNGISQLKALGEAKLYQIEVSPIIHWHVIMGVCLTNAWGVISAPMKIPTHTETGGCIHIQTK